MKHKPHLTLLIILAALARLPSCGLFQKRTPMVKTTTTAGMARAFGASASPTGPITTTETPFESETHKSFGKAAENLFTP